MSLEEVHINDIGTKFLVTVNENGVALDISTASVKSIIFKKPDGTLLTKTATFGSNGTDGKIYYLSVSGDLNLSGKWQLQAAITLSSGAWRTSVSEFNVLPNL